MRDENQPQVQVVEIKLVNLVASHIGSGSGSGSSSSGNVKFLATREQGKSVVLVLQEMLRAGGGNRVIAISFEGIDFMEASFADEVFVSLAVARVRKELTERAALFFLTHLNDVHLENLAMALDTRPDREELAKQSQLQGQEQGRGQGRGREKLRNCVLPIQLEASAKLQLLGKMEEHVRQTFDLLNRHGELNTRQVADTLNLPINAASTRLKVLADLGLALRTEIRDSQGKQFIYSVLA